MSDDDGILLLTQLEQLYHDLGGADGLGVLDEIIASYDSSANEHIAELSKHQDITSLSDEDYENIAYHAHTLKGMALNLGMRAMADTAAWIEQNSRVPSEEFVQQLSQLIHLLPDLQSQSLEALKLWRSQLVAS